MLILLLSLLLKQVGLERKPARRDMTQNMQMAHLRLLQVQNFLDLWPNLRNRKHAAGLRRASSYACRQPRLMGAVQNPWRIT
mmetsp:Transcript_33806/g.80232  ORF Transcript_33806/g.80232 Transcript_33806/m.80232 type:complete len:82 (-) Transcript_33806:1093-1338(-)